MAQVIKFPTNEERTTNSMQSDLEAASAALDDETQAAFIKDVMALAEVLMCDDNFEIRIETSPEEALSESQVQAL